MNTKKGIVKSWNRKGTVKKLNQREAIAKKAPQKSIIAVGIENSPMNHEYQGRIPKNIDPPAKTRYKNWGNVR